MGDFIEISNVDLEGSLQFLKRFVVSQKLVPHIQLIESRQKQIWEIFTHAGHYSGQLVKGCILVFV